MKKIVVFLSFILCLGLLFTGCTKENMGRNTKESTVQSSNENNNEENKLNEENNQENTENEDNNEESYLKTEKSKIYALAFDAVWEIDEALNSDINYVSINTKTFKDFSEEDKSELFDYIQEKYNVTMLDMSFEELQDEGYVKDLYFEEGILFEIDRYSSNSIESVSFEGSKWRSGLGAIGFYFEGVKKDDKWEVEECKMTWIS
ncbi:hypothetical protein [Oceanirhabdus sp. W0125-5]|uniref:hypothetical protein n=1 Tax=Oceanirhabdus sp. W0125-5 TaxID=2999116 RepID=UPI0022F2EF81|nr:hypothetical protein [Oceanirhabdus sp. W0125-5]WBW95693.1 hypothetical protein OW730_18615 [Oceanirhabdus sp. W0125-5]